MTFFTCKKIIISKKAKLDKEDFFFFFSEIKNKLDVFLLANRINEIEYKSLIEMLDG